MVVWYRLHGAWLNHAARSMSVGIGSLAVEVHGVVATRLQPVSHPAHCPTLQFLLAIAARADTGLPNNELTECTWSLSNAQVCHPLDGAS